MNRKKSINDGKFILIDCTARDILGMTNDQYAIADTINCLSGAKNNTTPGWCHASKEYLADHAGVSRRTIFRMIEFLKEQGLVEGSGTLLKTTKKWEDTVIKRRMQKQRIFSEINKRIGNKSEKQ